MALLIKANGERREVTVPASDQLVFLQQCVGGNIEQVPLLGDCPDSVGYAGAFCDEEGKIKGRPINEVATEMAGRDNMLGVNDPLVGAVLFFKEGEVD